MDPTISNWMDTVLRWIHVVAGIAWIGHLYFFNFVNAHVAKTYDADSKKKVVPELMPRALYWFRWGAAYTWLTGILLIGLVYHMQKLVEGPGLWLGLGVILLAFFVYDLLWKSPLAKKEEVGVGVSFVLLAAVTFGLSTLMNGRSLFIHVGSTFGTIMAMNVWMRIWPGQRKIIAGIKGTGPAADAALPAFVALRSKHNAYMSVPLVLFMLGNHFTGVYTSTMPAALALGFVVVGWLAARWLFSKSASAAPTTF